MPRKVAAGLVNPVRASAVELFFDLVFIFTLGRLPSTLAEEPSWVAAAQAVIFLLAFWTVVFLWWTYFYRTTSNLAVKINDSADPYRVNLRAGYTHLLMVAGILLTGIGGELMLKAPGGKMSAGDVVAILVGPVLFLVGRLIFEAWVFGQLTKYCLTAVVGCLILSPVAAQLPPLAVGLLGAATITAVAAFDLTIRARLTGAVNPTAAGGASHLYGRGR
ncbi:MULTISPECIES: low temperature requirement protein A [unclassified Micromonospora]|uniref:low temperature requirement protein A n=1 Tax=unclassified Micromonospora TaxID=2617518 RepID=UPI0033B24F3C